MKLSTLLVLALITLFSASETHAAETSTPEERTLELFQHYLKAKDWQMAEVIARGAVGKFGTNSQIVGTMRILAKVSAEGNLNIEKRFEFLPQPKPIEFLPESIDKSKYYGPKSTSVYNLSDLIAQPNSTPTNAYKRLSQLSAEIDRACSKDALEGEILVEQFRTNLSIVVSASPERHGQVRKYLESKRAERSQK